MIEQQMPFRRILLTSDTFQILKEGQIISTFNKCGIFYCQRGSVEVSLEGCHYHIKPGDVYIYMASTLVHLLHKSEDAEGIMVELLLYSTDCKQSDKCGKPALYAEKSMCLLVR